MTSQVFYLTMDSADVTLPVSALGLNLDRHICGLFSVNGKLVFTSTPPPQQRYFLCSDICDQDSILTHSLQLPVLRELIITPSNIDPSNKTVLFHHEFSQILWLDIKPTQLRNLRLFLRDDQGQTLPVADCLLQCTLLVFAKK